MTQRGRPKGCLVCRRPDRQKIDATYVVEGGTVRAIATKFKLSHSAVARHREHVIRDMAAVAAHEPTADQVFRADNLMEKLQALHTKALKILSDSEAMGDRDLALKAMARAEKQIELAARLLGQIRDAQINLNVGVATIDDATMTRMAEVYLARRQRPAIETTTTEDDG